MDILIYDGTFQGFLTVIYDIYNFKLTPVNITTEMGALNLFGIETKIIPNEQKSKRVELGLKKKISTVFFHSMLLVYHAEWSGREMLLYRIIKKIFKSFHTIEDNYADTDVRELKNIEKQYLKEAHRMYAFVRFNLYQGELYFATIEPDFNMIPFIGPFFMERFADQIWLIYDIKRQKGMYYDKEKISIVHADFVDETKVGDPKESTTKTSDEKDYCELWRSYFSSVNIPERINIKLQKSHMPKRYWKFLPEMNKK